MVRVKMIRTCHLQTSCFPRSHQSRGTFTASQIQVCNPHLCNLNPVPVRAPTTPFASCRTPLTWTWKYANGIVIVKPCGVAASCDVITTGSALCHNDDSGPSDLDPAAVTPLEGGVALGPCAPLFLCESISTVLAAPEPAKVHGALPCSLQSYLR
jgi:hypothetical protein